jgi:hypothetical protein
MAFGCDHPYPNEIACIQMNGAPNCSVDNPLFFDVHFITANTNDFAGLLHRCISSYAEVCKRSCGFCWKAIVPDTPLSSHLFSYEYPSYEVQNRIWTIRAEGPGDITSHSVYLITSYANTIISLCERSSIRDQGWIAYAIGAGVMLSCMLGAGLAMTRCCRAEDDD